MAENGNDELLAAERQSTPPESGDAPKPAKKSKFRKIIIGLAIIGIIIGGTWLCGVLFEPSEEEKETQRFLERELGYHCLAKTRNAVRSYVQASMLDRSSFEHIESNIFPVNKDGFHKFEMRFSGRNKLGLQGISTATTKVRQEDCSVGLVQFE